MNEEEKIEEVPSVEPLEKQENVVEEERNEPLDNKVKEKPTFEYDDDALKNIEDSRKEFLAFYKRQRIWKWVIGIAALAIVITSLIVLPNTLPRDAENALAKSTIALMWIITGVTLALVVTYTLVIKRVINKKMKQYFSNFYEQASIYSFQDDCFTDVSLQIPDKISKIQFDENMMYRNVSEVGSRGLTEFKYNGELMMVCDCAAQVRAEKRIMPVFVGKYLVGPASYGEAEPIVIYLRGDHRSLPPTNLDEIKDVYDKDDIVIYSNNKDWAKVVNAKVIKALKNIEIGKELIDVAISVLNGKVYMCLGFDDPLMVLPLMEDFNPEPYKEYRKQLNAICKVAEELSKWVIAKEEIGI